jgi:hypothetical protein
MRYFADKHLELKIKQKPERKIALTRERTAAETKENWFTKGCADN